MSSWWKFLNTPSSFKDDWYGELTNQCGHTLLGVLAPVLLCNLWFFIFGGMPIRTWVFVIPLTAYVSVELFIQGWRPGDTWFDIWMFGLGAAGAMLPLQEIEFSDSGVTLSYDPKVHTTIFVVWAVTLFFRVRERLPKND